MKRPLAKQHRWIDFDPLLAADKQKGHTMAQAKKKTAAAASTETQFRVVGKDEAPAPKGKLNLGGLRKSTDKTSSKANHPIVTVSEEAMAFLQQYMEHIQPFKDLDKLVGPKGSIKAQLNPHIIETYFRRFAGGTPDSTMLVDVGGKLVKLVTKNRYSTKCTNVSVAADHFREVVMVKIDMEKIAEENQQPLVDAILAVAEARGITEGIEYTSCLQPKAGFHEMRTTLLTPEENIALNAEIPLTAYPQI